MAFTPDISVAIILVNWNGLSFTKACLQSLKKVDFPSFRVIVVDNASRENEGEILEAEFPEILLIQSPENLGFTGGNNLGVKKALEMGFSHILLLNNDTLVEPDFLGKMMLKMNESAKIGVVQPLICFLGSPKKIWSAGGKWNAFLSRAITKGDRKNLENFSLSDQKLDWATGCCMLIRREAILESGLLQEQYFAYFEDVEWSLRFGEKGWEIHLDSQAKIYHEAGASSKKKHAEGTLSPRVFYFHVRNQFYLIRSNNQFPVLAYGYHFVRFFSWMSYFMIRGRFQKVRAVAKGLKDGFTTVLNPAPRWP
ncbi:glycosyltransferase family 2 protein [Algoriphagus sp.]|uniref:glycosyltransferase family 2 protein n=1 Tax=Algoriphagus sp. TaxID=1872435 RepID=UPI0026174755|nr:glycosyltransferase family 2 protein [Algoriphagus sp.]